MIRTAAQRAYCFGARQLASESGTRTSLEAHYHKEDRTRYRIPLLTEDENTMWLATMKDQWKEGLRPKNLHYPSKEIQFQVRPNINPMPIEHFNYTLHDFATVKLAKEFSEFSLFLSPAETSDIHYQRRSLPGARSVAHLSSALTGKNMKQKSLGMDRLTGNGWSHNTDVGKSFGPPRMLNDDDTLSDERYDTNFDSRLLSVDMRSRYYSKGKIMGFRVVVAVGNKKGLLGVGITFRKNMMEAMLEAKEYAYRQLVPMPMTEAKGVPYTSYGRYHQTELKVVPCPAGSGNKAHRIVKCLLDLSGYDNVAIKMFGRNNPESLCKAFMVAMHSFESPQQQANNTGRYVVRFDPSKCYKPEVLAEPNTGTQPVPFTAELSRESQGL